MLDEMDDEEMGRPRTQSVDIDLNSEDTRLHIDILDAISDYDKVIFTIVTKTSIPQFDESDFKVVRIHEEFVWLHNDLVDNPEYAGVIVPPAPPNPDFDGPRTKLALLSEGEGNMTKDEFEKLKTELQAQYLATFKKTVSSHLVFLTRLAAHPTLHKDCSFRVFLTYGESLSVRGKSKKEKMVDLLHTFQHTVDQALLAKSIHDEDEFFRRVKYFLIDFHIRVKKAAAKADRVNSIRKVMSEDLIRLSVNSLELANVEPMPLCSRLFKTLGEFYEDYRKLEIRICSDEDLKLSEILKHYIRETQAAKELLYRRTKSLAEYVEANKALDKARVKRRNIAGAEDRQIRAYDHFNAISESGQKELEDFSIRRIQYFQKNLLELTELQLRHARGQLQVLKTTLTMLKSEGDEDRGACASGYGTT